MCEFVSWVEHEDKLYYLTANLLNTKEGRDLKKFLATAYYEDIKGHGAIERYFGIKGKHHECTDFSSTQNFPDEIVKALQAGAFRGIGIPSASQVLTEKAYADYLSKRDALYADYEYKRDPLYAEYTSKRDDLFWNIFMDKKNRVKAWK
jgi:hypothetical protein